MYGVLWLEMIFVIEWILLGSINRNYTSIPSLYEHFVNINIFIVFLEYVFKPLSLGEARNQPIWLSKGFVILENNLMVLNRYRYRCFVTEVKVFFSLGKWPIETRVLIFMKWFWPVVGKLKILWILKVFNMLIIYVKE